MHNQLPWPRLLEIAYGILCIAPETFWTMTPCEFLSALRGFKQWNGIAEKMPMTREELHLMREIFPDQ